MPTLVQNPNGSITVSVTFELIGSMPEMENIILDAVNEVGCIGTEEALKHFVRHNRRVESVISTKRYDRLPPTDYA